MTGAPHHGLLHLADVLATLGAESRLRIVQLLLRAHPSGATAGEIATALGISASTLSHHLDRLKREQLVLVERQGTYLRYTANPVALEAVLRFLHAECRAAGYMVRMDENPTTGSTDETGGTVPAGD